MIFYTRSAVSADISLMSLSTRAIVETDALAASTRSKNVTDLRFLPIVIGCQLNRADIGTGARFSVGTGVIAIVTWKGTTAN
jgi:hypothetical protein